MAPILGIYASSQQASKLANFYSIATSTVGAGGAASITFSSIPQTYSHLQIRAFARSTVASGDSETTMQFNGSSASYYGHQIFGNVSSVTVNTLTTTTSIDPIYLPGATNGVNTFNIGITDILDYTSTNKNKTTRTLTGYEQGTAGIIFVRSGLWFATPAAITSIVISPVSGNFAQYSSFALYGVL